MKNKKMMKRVLTIALSVLLLVCTLVSCTASTNAYDVTDEEKDNPTAYFKRVLMLESSAAARQAFVAAYRGYNTSFVGFNDGDAEKVKSTAAVSVNTAAAKQALLEAAEALKNAEGSTFDFVAFEQRLTSFDASLAGEVINWLSVTDDQWNSKKSEEKWAEDTAVYFADIVRNGGKKDAFLATKGFAEANPVRPHLEYAKAILLQAGADADRVNAQLSEAVSLAVKELLALNDEAWAAKLETADWENDHALYFASKVREAGLTETYKANAAAVTHPTFNLAEGHEIAVSVAGAKAALAQEALRPENMSNESAVKVSEWTDALTVQQIKDIVHGMQTEVSDESDRGIFDWILLGFGKFLGLITKITGGYYVPALLIFAIIIEAALIYFSIRQQKNSIKMAGLSPKEQAIRKRYAGRTDQVSMRRMQEEIQKLYQEEGYNPMSGCLPMLIQMPILIGLYRLVIDPLKYMLGMSSAYSNALTTFVQTSRAAGGLGQTVSGNGTIQLLGRVKEHLGEFESFAYFNNSAACAETLKGVDLPNFDFMWLDTSLTPSFKGNTSVGQWFLLLIPVLTFAAYFFSMKINRKLSYQPATASNQQMGCSNNMMDFTMPLMSVVISFGVPAVIGIYWIFKCLVGVGKQFIIHKAMPLPKFSEEDYKRAEKEMKARSKGRRLPTTIVVDDTGRQYRSLHSIDEEDELPPVQKEDQAESDDKDDE